MNENYGNPALISSDGCVNEGKRSLLIREIAIADAEAAARLSDELGYPVPVNAMERRIEILMSLKDHIVYVACLPDAVVGWIDLGITHHLQSEPYGEIGGLVVSSDCRNRGIGRRLVVRAEQWAAHRGIARMVVRSRIARLSGSPLLSSAGIFEDENLRCLLKRADVVRVIIV